MPMSTFDSPPALAAVIGQPSGHSDWKEVSQDMIDAFAAVTGDRQWNVDVERARREAPGGSIVANGGLLLSLLGILQPQIYSVPAPRALNYGLNRPAKPLVLGAFRWLDERLKSGGLP
jgi:acyl dehydratase